MSEYMFDRIAGALEEPDSIVYIRDIDGKYVYVNDHYEKSLPFTRKQVMGKTNRELYGEEAARSWEATDMLTSAARTFTVTEESLYDRSTKKWRRFISTKSLISDVMGNSYLAGISVEIKDKKAIEYERRLATMRATLLELLTSS